jgi:hypothetical protein
MWHTITIDKWSLYIVLYNENISNPHENHKSHDANYLIRYPYWTKEYELLNTHKYILLDNIEWLTNEHMSFMQKMIYIGHLKNQQ